MGSIIVATGRAPHAREMTDSLHPGAPRLVMFHFVAAGRCRVTATGGERCWAERGDVIVLPYGDQHDVGGLNEAGLVPIRTLFEPPPWDSLPVVRYGAGGDRTDIVCGYLHSGDPLFDPGLRAFPPVFVGRHPRGRWRSGCGRAATTRWR